MLIFQSDIVEKLYSHAQTEYPKECCGILIGKRQGECRIAGSVVQTVNMAEESQNTTQFLIHPLEIVKAEVLAEREGLEIVGFYHSHPDYEAVASDEDILHMIAEYSYLILSVKNGVCEELNSFEKIIQTDTAIKEEILVKER